jgi:hypothetical protein
LFQQRDFVGWHTDTVGCICLILLVSVILGAGRWCSAAVGKVVGSHVGPRPGALFELCSIAPEPVGCERKKLNQCFKQTNQGIVKRRLTTPKRAVSWTKERTWQMKVSLGLVN